MNHDADERVFREPWEAHAFAITVKLHERGLFTWTEWAEALSRQIHSPDAAAPQDSGERYYHHWLAALESLVSARGAASEPELANYRQAWLAAADRTPHGHPIELAPSDFPG